jgi:hypothetical protein
MVEQEKLKIGDTVWCDIYDDGNPLECEVEYLHGGTTISIKAKDRPSHVTGNYICVGIRIKNYCPTKME